MEKNGLETELRLGLPGGGEAEKNEKKRDFSNFSGDEDRVVGWPPVRRFGGGKMYVKVSMDGAPFLRKIDVGLHKGYSQLLQALQNLFGSHGIGEAMKDEEKSEYVGIYEDKDGDWMLLGDVPWEMFASSCKRLRIMKRAVGIQAKDLLKGLSYQ